MGPHLLQRALATMADLQGLVLATNQLVPQGERYQLCGNNLAKARGRVRRETRVELRDYWSLKLPRLPYRTHLQANLDLVLLEGSEQARPRKCTLHATEGKPGSSRYDAGPDHSFTHKLPPVDQPKASTLHLEGYY